MKETRAPHLDSFDDYRSSLGLAISWAKVELWRNEIANTIQCADLSIGSCEFAEFNEEITQIMKLARRIETGNVFADALELHFSKLPEHADRQGFAEVIGLAFDRSPDWLRSIRKRGFKPGLRVEVETRCREMRVEFDPPDAFALWNSTLANAIAFVEARFRTRIRIPEGATGESKVEYDELEPTTFFALHLAALQPNRFAQLLAGGEGDSYEEATHWQIHYYELADLLVYQRINEDSIQPNLIEVAKRYLAPLLLTLHFVPDAYIPGRAP